MHHITGTFTTPNGSKYLQQLCKHFAHKIEVENDETTGTLKFPMGVAQLAADAEGLKVNFELDEPDEAERARHVIDKHLERFAFREDFKHMDWDTPA